MSIYNQEYTKKYIERTLGSGYTIYKNTKIASVASKLNKRRLVDIGCNVSPLIKREGSLRYQTEKVGIDYFGVDIHESYFNPAFAKGLGVPEADTYQEVKGVVCDIFELENVFSPNSQELMVCADVIEHIPSPKKALQKLYDSLAEQGVAIIVVPSMYKLDAVQFEHIMRRRVSSHENRLTVNDWVSICREVGFSLNTDLSVPVGIGSGITYLAWLIDDFIPRRQSIDDKEYFSECAQSFKDAKNQISIYDSIIDVYFADNPHELEDLFQLIITKKFSEVFEKLISIISEVHRDANVSKINQLTNELHNREIKEDRLVQLVNTIAAAHEAINDNIFIGNSALLVLEK